MPEIDSIGCPNSCIIKIERNKYRTLVDTGAEVSLIHRRVYESLQNKPRLISRNINLQTVSGLPLKVDGCINLMFSIGGTDIQHMFYVMPEINRNVILGKDWLTANGVRLYFDLGCMRIGKVYVILEEDIHIASIIRLNSNLKLKPQTAKICYGKTKLNPKIPTSFAYEISAYDKGYIASEPGLMVSNAVSVLGRNRRLPLLIVNNTNKEISLKKGCPVARIINVASDNVVSINSALKTEQKPTTFSLIKTDLSCPQIHSELIEDLIKENCDLFASKDSELGQTDTVKMTIDTGHHAPIKLRPYRTPLQNRKVIDNAIDEMLDAKIIRRSRSPWSFPIVIVGKKDGTKRFCVDFRQLNKITKKNSYPLPLIDDILALLGRAKYFTSLDLKSGYWQVSMEEHDKQKTAFSCHRGLFEFNKMPFGLCNAPSIFQELMSIVLEGLGNFSTAYLDDILVYSATLDEHLKHLQIVFNRLRTHSLKLKLKKCSFLQKETTYLGFVINEYGVKPDPSKVKAIQSLQSPINVKQVRSFIGMCSYYRRFIPNFSKIAEPIINLTKKHAKFRWSEECQKAFEFLKSSLTVVPLLAYPDPNKPYILYTDASDTCIGACLTQECSADDRILPNIPHEKPIYFLSHRLSRSQCKWSTIEKEAFAIHFALSKLDYYLHNARFTIKTDHRPLRYILDSPMQNKKIQLWALELTGYNCDVTYIKGTDNTCADLLSRSPSSEPFNESEAEHISDIDVNRNTYEIGIVNSNQLEPKVFARCDLPQQDNCKVPKSTAICLNMTEEQNKDSDIVELKTMLRHSNPSKHQHRRHIILNDILYYISNPDDDPFLRIYVPNHLKSLVTTQYHDQLGHMGVQKTFENIKKWYYWPNLYKDINDYVTTCVTCQTRSKYNIKQPLQETDFPPYPFAKVSLDISGPYSTTFSGNKYIVAFVDWYSGWGEAFAVPDKSAETVAHLLIDDIVTRYGCPLQLVTDNGTENVNRIMRETLQELNIDHVRTSIYHSQSNTRVERFHRTLQNIISKKLLENQQTWDLHLNQALSAIRFNISESSKFSPFYLLYNRDVVLPVDNLLKPRTRYHGEDLHKIALQEQHRCFLLVRRHIKHARDKQNKYANKNRKEVLFEVNDPVYFKNNQMKGKLDIKWRPYYRIIEKKSPTTYVIKNQLDGTTVKVHADLIKPAKIDDWVISQDNNGRPIRNATYVVPPDITTEEDSEIDQNIESEREQKPQLEAKRELVNNRGSSSEDTKNDIPSKLINKYKKERENSDSDDNIPLLELAKRLKNRSRTKRVSEISSNSSDDDPKNQKENTMTVDATDDEMSDDAMSVNQVSRGKRDSKSNSRKRKCRQLFSKTAISNDSCKVKKLLEAIVGIL
jgi:hypothetical protein